MEPCLIQPKIPNLSNIDKQLLRQQEQAQLSQLLARCRLKDRKAFKQLYELTASKLTGIAYRILNDVDSANEVLQEGFLQIWQHSDRYQAELADAMAWMSSIVRYRAYDKLKHDKRYRNDAELDEHHGQLSCFAIEQDFQNLQTQDNISRCLGILSEQSRQAILLAYYQGHSREEIAQVLATSINTVKSWLRRGLGRLQQCLEH